jgi:hypothetical protein
MSPCDKTRLVQTAAASNGYGHQKELLPILFLHHLQTSDLQPLYEVQKDVELLKRRLKMVLQWAVPLAPEALRIVECRVGDSPSIVPTLLPDHCVCSDILEVYDIQSGFSPRFDLLGSRVLVCGGILETIIYPCHDLLRSGNHQVCIVPQLCGTSGRSGELSRADAVSHLEEVLGVLVLGSIKGAVTWLVPPLNPSAGRFSMVNDFFEDDDVIQFTVISSDDTMLSILQKSILCLLFSRNVTALKLHKLGKGYCSSVKFFCTPIVERHGTSNAGAVTFVKIGLETEVEEELRTTHHMMQLLGNFCPQVLGYAEMEETAALHLSLADLACGSPQGFADLYSNLVTSDYVIAGTPEGDVLLQRLETAIDFIFTNPLSKIHNCLSSEWKTTNVLDELGLSKDMPNGCTGLQADVTFSSGWVLEKLWRKKPGNGQLAESVYIHMVEILGRGASDSTLTFLHLTVPNVYTEFLSNPAAMNRLRVNGHFCFQQCMVHGDLHGDNIMIDSKDNRFLIDFGKTGLGHSLEDVTWLECFILFSYTQLENDSEMSDVLHMINVLAPCHGLDENSCEPFVLEAEIARQRMDHQSPETVASMNPRTAAMWAVLKRLRAQMGKEMAAAAQSYKPTAQSYKRPCSECKRLPHRNIGMVAALLLLRNSLFFISARENKASPRRRKIALAAACAYARSAINAKRPHHQ